MFKIKDTPILQRPREKAIKYGFNTLSDAELLAIIIKTGTKEFSAVEIAKQIINKYENFINLSKVSINELMLFKGVKKVKAIEIMAVNEILKRMMKNHINSLEKIKSPNDIVSYFEKILRNENQEVFIVVFLDVKNQIIKYETLFKGGINFSLIDVNIIFKRAIDLCSVKIICLHNHPSGDAAPSTNDIEITKKINAIGKILGITLLDHIIIGKGKYTSLMQRNILD